LGKKKKNLVKRSFVDVHEVGAAGSCFVKIFLKSQKHLSGLAGGSWCWLYIGDTGATAVAETQGVKFVRMLLTCAPKYVNIAKKSAFPTGTTFAKIFSIAASSYGTRTFASRSKLRHWVGAQELKRSRKEDHQDNASFHDCC